MFVRYFTELALPADRVAEALSRSPGEWVPELAREAAGTGEELLTTVGIGSNHHRVARRVALEIGEPIRYESKTAVPMVWRPSGFAGLLPELSADVEVAALGPARSQLSISARYDAPLGAVGRTADRFALHRVAEATVKDFLDRVGAAIIEQAGGGRARAGSD